MMFILNEKQMLTGGVLDLGITKFWGVDERDS